MIALRRLGLAAALVAAAGVWGTARRQGPPADVARLLAARRLPPAEAAAAFARLGPVPGWEGIRFRWWLEALVDSDAGATAWRRYLHASPPPPLARRAELELARRRLASGAPGAVETLLRLEASGEVGAAEALLAAGEEGVRLGAARWLAVHAPGRLHRADRTLERRALASLGPRERLERVRAWAAARARRRAAGELARLERRGLPGGLRTEAAAAWMELGRPRRALRLLPARPRGEAARVAAAAWRALAWARYPGRGARGAFRRCAELAHRAGMGGLPLELECATEAGELARAWRAWRELAARGWSDRRRAWLGRRLGVALALAGRTRRVERLALEIPGERRCLAYWAAVRTGDAVRLRRLAARPVADLYALWARAVTGGSRPVPPPPPPEPAAEAPPWVRWLVAAGEGELALAAWWRAVGVRGARPGEALALAEREAAAGRRQAAVRALRAGWPELDRAELWRVPRRVQELYLPLPWRRELEAAAAEAGIPPWILAAVARQESTFEPEARSPRGAVGVVQLRRGTARRHARRLGLGRDPDLTDPAVSLRLGAAELARLRGRLGSGEAALAAYNAGERRVRRWLRGRSPDRRWVESIPVPETYRYVRRVAYLAEGYRAVWWPRAAGEGARWWSSR